MKKSLDVVKENLGRERSSTLLHDIMIAVMTGVVVVCIEHYIIVPSQGAPNIQSITDVTELEVFNSEVEPYVKYFDEPAVEFNISIEPHIEYQHNPPPHKYDSFLYDAVNLIETLFLDTWDWHWHR
ncbi:MAG: hypothetical protein ATN34_04420 [Epulopiscium sp. Nele67-Bin002]|nr:MAG: hypothetical protein BEN18_05655 [Epulopiscium sp. Nuni2H_MBin001]OON90484.1 MAG: hypothetical protein ATN33_02865 [Epulopiscium sp. Nele67-Bin001]OON91145.1 MAG: hypothetical protein ATN34_04420 [Epulopiscium sp. Nele67-Bin002]